MNNCSAGKHVSCDHDLNSFVTDDLIEDMEMVGSVEGIMEKRVSQGKLSRLIDDKSCRASFTPAYVKMSNMYFVPLRQLLKNIVMAGRDRMMDIILS
jgi:hypothetical protein